MQKLVRIWQEFPAQYFTAKNYLSEQIRNHGLEVENTLRSLETLVVAGADVAVQQFTTGKYAAGKVAEMRPELNVEARFDKNETTADHLDSLLAQRGFVKWGKTSLGNGRRISFYHIPKGELFIDLIPQSDPPHIALFDQDRPEVGRYIIAEKFLRRRLHEHDMNADSVCEFIEHVGGYCDTGSIHIKKLLNTDKRQAGLLGSYRREFVLNEVVYYMKEAGYELVQRVNANASKGAAVFKLEDGTVMSIFLQPGKEE